MFTLGRSSIRAAALYDRGAEEDSRSLCAACRRGTVAPFGLPREALATLPRGAESRLMILGGEGVRGAHVPAAWPLPVRYNGSVDSSEEWELTPLGSAATSEPRVHAREKPSSPVGECEI